MGFFFSKIGFSDRCLALGRMPGIYGVYITYAIRVRIHNFRQQINAKNVGAQKKKKIINNFL